jgi:FlaA1/EpsC-like NDP-sugar epimerase
MSSNNSQQSAKKPAKIRVEHWQKIMIFLIFYDVAAVSFSYFIALILRFDLRFSQIPATYLNPWMKFAPIYAVMCLLIFWFFRLYQSIWQFASLTEFIRITEASALASLLHIILITLLFQRMPISYYIMGAGIQFFFLLIIRFAYRFLLMFRAERNKTDVSRGMLIGAGSAGQTILRDMRDAKEVNEKVVCIIDDNRNKWGRDVEGIRVVGGRDSIIENVQKYKIDKIYIALPSASARSRKNVIDICRQTDCEIKNLPGIYQLVLGEVSVSQMRKINVEDLLGREPVEMGSKEVTKFLNGKTVLVTGGGGSIGSELCRQVAAVPSVKRLIIFDIYENNAHAIKLELQDKYPDLDLVVLIGSVRDSRKIKEVFRDYRPDIVFHAAAHKHVPLMEDSPCEAIKNNAIGTYYTAFAAMAYNCEKFVMISTDKAVNPVNVMGASKRICEMIVQTFARKIEAGKASELPDLNAHTGALRTTDDRLVIPDHPRTEFVAVRFGNVLGSNGSVIPRFTEQIASGGPVTVTHPDIIRYFMTIPEAASLVLTAATFGGGGKIFVLDMGTPVKIADLAKDMIRLAGLKPNEDIKIVYTGLRPGEKLYEERLMDEEGLQKTSNELINIGSPIAFDEDKFLVQLRGLMEAAYEDRENIRELIAEVVPTYHPAGRHGTEEKGEAYRQQRAEMYASAHKGENADGPQE